MKLRMLFFVLLWAVLVSCSGGGSSSETDDDVTANVGCTDGEIRYIECTPGGGGIVVDEDSHDDSGLTFPDESEQTDSDDSLIIPDESEQQDESVDDALEIPDEDATLMQVLAISGLQQQVCRNNQWLNEGECSADIATAPCENDEVRFLACGDDNAGMQKQICAAGEWTDRGSCVEGGIGGESDCDTGDTLKVPCGADSTGTGTLSCEDNQWVMTECDTAPCLNGDIQIISCGESSEGSQRRVCVAGGWQNDGSCTFNAVGGEFLTAKIDRNAMGGTQLIEEFSYKTDGTDTWKDLFRIKETVSGFSDIPVTIYEVITTQTGAVLSRTTATVAGNTITGWKEEEWGEGVMPLEDGTMSIDGRTRLVNLDKDGLVTYELLITYDLGGNIVSRATTYLDSGAVDRETYFGTGGMLTKTEAFTAEGVRLSISVRDFYGNMIMKEEQLADGRDVENYINVHNASLNEFSWTVREFDVDENLTIYKENNSDGGSLYALTYTYADGHITQEKCATPEPERKACTTWETIPVGNYTIAYTYSGETLTQIEKSAMVDGTKEIISLAVFAVAPLAAVGKVETYFTAEARAYCQHKFTNWEDRDAVDYLCDSTDTETSANGLIHLEKWTWDVQGRLLTKVGKIDPDSATDKTYRDSYNVTDGLDGKTEKTVYTNNYNMAITDSIEYHYTWVGDTMNEKKYTVASAVPTFIYNYAITKTFSGDLLTSVEMKKSSEDGVTVNAWDIYEYNAEGSQIKHIEKRADGTVYIERTWFDTHEVSGATRMAVDGTTVIETYSYATPGILESSFCEAEGCTAPILAHGYTLNGIAQLYWNETYTYDGEGRELTHQIDGGVDDGTATGVIVMTPSALFTKDSYDSTGTRFRIEEKKDYPDCWTTPGVWDGLTSLFVTHSAIDLHRKYRMEEGEDYEFILEKATWIDATIEIPHTFVEFVYGANGLIVASCDYENCFSPSLACSESQYLSVPHDNTSVCNNSKWTVTYDDNGNKIKEVLTDLSDQEWEVIDTTWQQIDTVWVVLKTERAIKGYTIHLEEYNDKGQLIEIFNDAPRGVNMANDPALEFSHIKYEYDEHGNLSKEIYLNRADEEYRFILHDNRYNTDDQLEMILRKDQDGRILGSTQMLYGAATLVE